MVDMNSLEIGQTILFKSISDYDNVTRRCIIEGFANYSLAKKYEDILPYYQEVKKTNPSIAPIEKLSFMILKIYENNTPTNEIIFAKEWIEPSSLQILVENKYVDIRVYEIDSNIAKTVMDILKSNGYLCKQI